MLGNRHLHRLLIRQMERHAPSPIVIPSCALRHDILLLWGLNAVQIYNDWDQRCNAPLLPDSDTVV
jgi:hypothetical protein